MPNLDKFLYLLYDYVHVMKCVRNNWLTETNGELKYEWNGETLIAKWNVLRHLHLVESSSLIKLSKLNCISKTNRAAKCRSLLESVLI